MRCAMRFTEKRVITDFELHPTLASDTLVLGDMALSRVLLMNDARFPWLILVPRKAGLRELYELSTADAAELFTEINAVSRALGSFEPVDKLNVGALGNRVPQLHIHIVARHAGDPAWPGPVWGFGTTERYHPDMLKVRALHLRELLRLVAH